jgi:hypothetical protein
MLLQSKLHLHDFLVRRNNLVADLKPQVECHFGPLHRQRDIVQFAIAFEKLLNGLIGILLVLIYALNDGFQHGPETFVFARSN